MMKRFLLLSALALIAFAGISAQRVTDVLNRGLVAVKTTSGVFVSWRIQADEYYDVTYNLYRDGSLIKSDLTTSNFTDTNGTTTSSYKVEAVKRGVKTMSDAVTPWANNYLEIIPQHDASIHSTLVPNDACCADVDGDGVVEVLLKFDNQNESSNYMQKEGYYGEYTILEVLKLDGTLLWWVNCGPNMGDFQNNEQNIVGYDWDMDGKAEVLMRLEEGSVIHMSEGSTYTIGADGKNGTSWTNYREPRGWSPEVMTKPIAFFLSSTATASANVSWLTTKIEDGVLYVTTTRNTTQGDGTHGTGRTGTVTVTDGATTKTYNVFQLDQNAPSVEWFTHYGKEFLVYCEGNTGKPYQVIDFPCARFESGETDLNKAWGDGYGHRSSKFFFGAPYLDGRKPSIFVGRGIYTRHKFVALDVDPATHQLTERWRWMNNSSGPWRGQGYHNYAVVDVDWDGRDEIVWGSMVIDDNGKGLSTTGLGHGDAQHHGDFNPYIHGQEGFFCNEDRPSNNYRDLTTSKIYYRVAGSADDGRSIAGNFLNSVPGAVGFSAHDTPPISLVENKHLDILSSTSGIATNFRCYWDGDLQEETFNYVNGKNTEGKIYKPGTGSGWVLTGSMTNNDTKGTPCFMGDILGDWREEFILRTANNRIRIYTTTIPTTWRNYSLWYDHQYRNGMVWEMCGYNQPPHVSYFLGELEGITQAPPSLTMTGRTEVLNGGTISHNDQEVITCETGDMTVNITNGATPYLYIDNAPSWVQGSAPSEATASSYNITYQYYTHTLQGGGFAGNTRVVKQGDGTLIYPELDMTYSGNTDVWAGTLTLNGSIANSPLWLNRLTTLNTPAKPITVKSLAADYGSTIHVGGDDALGTMTATDEWKMGFGSRIKMDVYSDEFKADKINTAKLIVEKKDWTYGPEYKQPVIEFNCHLGSGATTLAAGTYILGQVAAVEGDLANIKIEGIAKVKASLAVEGGNLVLIIQGVRDAADIEWDGTISNVWDVASTENFTTHDPARSAETFIEGDNVYLTDNAKSTTIEVANGMELKPTNIYYTASKDYTIGGQGKIVSGTFYNNGTGAVTMTGDNTYTGGNHLTGGTTIVSSLSSATQAYGNLGGFTSSAANFTIENGAVLRNTTAVTNGSPIKTVRKGVLQTDANFTQQGTIVGDTLVKAGNGTLIMTANLTPTRTIVEAGSINYSGSTNSKVVELRGTSSITGAGFLTSTLNIANGANVTVTAVNRATSSNNLMGTGTVLVLSNAVSKDGATRSPLQLKMTNFEGTLVAGSYYNDGRFTFDTSTGSDKYTLNIPEGMTVYNSGRTLRIGALTGNGTLGGTCSYSQSANTTANTWQVGNATDFTFSGVVTSYDTFTKLGTGKMTVTKDWTSTGAVQINEGALNVSQVTLGTGALTVGKNGTLMGMNAGGRRAARNYPLTNSSVTINGALRFGSEGTTTSGAYWSFGEKPLTFGSTATLYIGIKNASTSLSATNCTTLAGITGTGSTYDKAGSVTFMDGATISVYLDSSYNPATNIGTDETKSDDFMVFYFATATVGEVVFDLPELPTNYVWDTSKFKDGYLSIRYQKATGISDIRTNNRNNGKIYTLDGKIVENPTKKSIYIQNGKKVVIK